MCLQIKPDVMSGWLQNNSHITIDVSKYVHDTSVLMLLWSKIELKKYIYIYTICVLTSMQLFLNFQPSQLLSISVQEIYVTYFH